MALPRIITGLRVSTVQVVATATPGGPGRLPHRHLIVTGFTSGEKGGLLAGAITVAAPQAPHRRPVRRGRAPPGAVALAAGPAADVAVIPSVPAATTAIPTGKGQTR